MLSIWRRKMFEALSARTTAWLQQLHTDYMFAYSHNPHTGFSDQPQINKELARAQQLSMTDIPQGKGPTTRDMVQPW